MLSISNSLAEYFHTINSKMPLTEKHEYIERRSLYVIFEGKMSGLYISFKEVVAQKKDGKLDGGISWKKYGDIDEAMNQARKILGTNYYIEAAAKEYIQKYRKAKGINIPETSSGIKYMAKKATYKDCLTKKVDPMDGQYIEMKIAQKFEMIFPEWKKTLKEEIMMELKGELYNKLEEFKRDFDAKMDISLSGSEENDDIAGHGQMLARPKIFGRVVLLCLISPTRYSPYDEQAVPPEGNTSPRTQLSRRHNSGLNKSIKRRGMKKGISFNGIETFAFGSENNKLRIFPPNSYKFRPKDRIILDEAQECILDNFWYQYNHKREEKSYMLSISKQSC
ncbi:hypothetical protein U9M48_041087 [Paspalum notatum var. saurae]|uniref:Uncharacterized protein n=1 Tax=Paspalum notatum var. saurae TaxID=547442 RepID=A0AAQ3UTQ9_PASNO